MSTNKNIKQEIKKFLAKAGKKGGKTTALRGSAHYSKIGKQGALKRWGKKLKVKSKKNDK